MTGEPSHCSHTHTLTRLGAAGPQGQCGGQLHGAEGGAGLDWTPDWGGWSGLSGLALGRHGRHAHTGVHQLTQLRSCGGEEWGGVGGAVISWDQSWQLSMIGDDASYTGSE